MKVAELIELLQTFDSEAHVVIASTCRQRTQDRSCATSSIQLLDCQCVSVSGGTSSANGSGAGQSTASFFSSPSTSNSS